MMKKLILSAAVLTTLFASSSLAHFAVGGYLGVNQQYPTAGEGSYTGRQGSEFGALLLMPLIPSLSLRFSLAQETRKTYWTGRVTTPFVVTYEMDFTETLLELGVGVQWDLPVTDLYVMGGAKVATAQKTECEVHTPSLVYNDCKTKTDYPIFAGVGYSVVSLPLFQVAIEGEYESGSSANFSGGRNSELVGRLVVKAGL